MIAAIDGTERRMAHALIRILQDGVEYLPQDGRDRVPVTADTYSELVSCGAVMSEVWDRLELEPQVVAALEPPVTPGALSRARKGRSAVTQADAPKEPTGSASET